MQEFIKMDWEESSPPPSSRELFEKNSSQSHNQHHNHFHHHRLITSSGSSSAQINYTNGSTSYRVGSHNHHGLNQAINLSESGKKIGFSSHHHFSSSSANTSPSGSSTSPSPPLILSTSCDSNGSSSNPSQVGTNLTITAASPSQPSPPDTTKTSSADSKSLNSNSTSTSSKKHKPIPPPLDLSIGAANLSLHSSEPDSSSPTPINLLHSANPIHGSCVTPHFFQPSYYYLGSPRGNPATEKSLPLRKRWHSWSPLLMNSQVDPMLPLFAETSGNGHNQSASENRNQDQTPTNATSTLSFSINPPSPWSTSTAAKSSQPGASNSQSNATASNKSSSKNNSNELQTPTPFYTPNEPSPKFMNSPVFSYSTPDTTLYQGPFSPIRTTTLFPPSLLPSSPFLGPSLNTPTFMTNTNGAHSSSNPISSFSNSLSGSTLTVPIFNGNGPSTASSSPHSTSSSSSVSTNFSNPLVPSTLLSPASSQASSSNSVSYEDLHEKSTLVSLNNSTKCNPVWNIFIPGTRIRFLHGINSMDWHLVDTLDLKDDYAPSGLEVKTLVVTSSAKERIQMTFSPVADLSHPVVEVNCEPWHPFMVEKKGWCAVNPDTFYETLGIRCQRLECGDICIKHSFANYSRRSPQQHHHQQIFQSPIQSDDLPYSNMMRNGFKMPTFNSPTPPPLDVKPSLDQLNISKSEYKSVSPLTNIPISVVRQKAQPTPNPPASNKKKSGSSASSASKKSKIQANSQPEPRGRRPMNAFLLFAKDKRPELIQMYPGKDNRSISVLLGEAWQSLGPVEKEQYASNARAKAEEQKRMHPDCWKRKKAQSSTSTNSNNTSSNSLSAPSHKSLPSFSPSSMLNFHSHIDEM